MKNLAMRIALTLAVCCSAFHLNAQALADVSGGSLTIGISAPLSALLATQNVTASAYTPAPYDWTIPFLGVQGGMFDLTTGSGNFAVQGNFVVTNAAGTVTLTVQQLQFEAVGKRAVITGTVYLNTQGIARMTIFEMTAGNPFPSPMVLGGTTNSGLSATLGSNFVAAVKSAFGVKIPEATPAATVSYDLGLVGVTL